MCLVALLLYYSYYSSSTTVAHPLSVAASADADAFLAHLQARIPPRVCPAAPSPALSANRDAVVANGLGQRRFLVYTITSDARILKQWNASPCARRFDIAVVSYAPPHSLQPPQPPVEFFAFQTGLKMELFARFVEEHRDVVRQYEAIWVVDDDIETTTEHINLMFDIFMALNLSLAMPSLAGASVIHHPHMDWRPGSVARFTNFVETGLPIISRHLLPLILPILHVSRSGHSADILISVRALDNAPTWPSRNVALIDATPIQHRSSPSSVDVFVHRDQQEVEGARLLLRAGLLSPKEWKWRWPYPRSVFPLPLRLAWVVVADSARERQSGQQAISCRARAGETVGGKGALSAAGLSGPLTVTPHSVGAFLPGGGQLAAMSLETIAQRLVQLHGGIAVALQREVEDALDITELACDALENAATVFDMPADNSWCYWAFFHLKSLAKCWTRPLARGGGSDTVVACAAVASLDICRRR